MALCGHRIKLGFTPPEIINEETLDYDIRPRDDVFYEEEFLHDLNIHYGLVKSWKNRELLPGFLKQYPQLSPVDPHEIRSLKRISAPSGSVSWEVKIKDKTRIPLSNYKLSSVLEDAFETNRGVLLYTNSERIENAINTYMRERGQPINLEKYKE